MLSFAIIGCGAVASYHVEQIRLKGKLVAVCDPDREAAMRIAGDTGARYYDVADDLLADADDIEVVVICTPNGIHAEHCIKSLQAGKQVLCEAPLCLTTAAAWQMIETEKFCRRKLHVVNLLGFEEHWTVLKKQLSPGVLEAPLEFELKLTVRAEDIIGWRSKLFPGGGMLYASFEPFLNLLVFLFGDLDRAEGFVRNGGKEADVEIGGEVKLWFNNGVRGELSWGVGEEKNSTIRVNKGNHTAVPDPAAPEMCRRAYASVYEHYLLSLSNKLPSNLYQSMKTVETIEKIYKAVLHKAL